MEECENCGHEEDEHHTNSDGISFCIGDGAFDNGDPVCDCTEFEELFQEDD